MDMVCSYCGYECEITPVEGYEDDKLLFCPRCGEEQVEDLEFND